MATTPLNSTTVIVDDTNPALVYSGVWVRFVSSAHAFPATKNVFTINILEAELQANSIPRLMAAHRRVLLYNLLSKVYLQCCIAPPS